MKLTFPFRQVLLGGPYNGAIIPTEWPEQWLQPELVLSIPTDWCVCEDGTVVETHVETHVYRLQTNLGRSHKEIIYVCDGWKACRCGRYIEEGEPECSRCRRAEDQELVSA